ncbi:hypothetical protein [Limnoglobus roseus]|uniref:TIGR02996 domain-containing protein n=1 Tax=Limnoglobus roseus TaxID=2598579 RepID=A0A5C1AB78_9BACT|nr:hypothetical protein [Limnoglobus roseus]QEL14278.1 hypothetical protein PX52LOC_01149 [Limnoglobus roseus]
MPTPTTEDEYQNHLDAHPDDWAARAAFAAFLESAGDARAAGHAMFVSLRKHSRRCEGDPEPTRTFFSARRVLWNAARALPATLFNEVVRKCDGVEGITFVKDKDREVEAIQGKDRRTLEDEVAKVFGRFQLKTQKKLIAEMLRKMGRAVPA